METHCDGGHSNANAQERWNHRLAQLPSMVVVESGSQWTHWLRRELRDLDIRVSRRTWSWRLDPLAVESSVIAWQVGIKNYEQVLHVLAQNRKERPMILQVALIDGVGLASGYCGLREAGAFHIQSDWYSSRSLKHVLSRYWKENSSLINDPMGQVIRQLPLRSN